MQDENNIISDMKDIPVEEGEINQYLATPLHTRPNMFMGKVFMHTNNQLQEYRNNGTYLEYLKQESIILDINDLDDINLVILGYMEYFIPR
jgi:hypothetical protein